MNSHSLFRLTITIKISTGGSFVIQFSTSLAPDLLYMFQIYNVVVVASAFCFAFPLLRNFHTSGYYWKILVLVNELSCKRQFIKKLDSNRSIILNILVSFNPIF